MIEIYLADMPGVTVVRCMSVEGAEAVRQLYIDSMANDIHMRDFCRDLKDNETAEVYQKRMIDKISTIHTIDRCISKYQEEREYTK